MCNFSFFQKNLTKRFRWQLLFSGGDVSLSAGYKKKIHKLNRRRKKCQGGIEKIENKKKVVGEGKQDSGRRGCGKKNGRCGQVKMQKMKKNGTRPGMKKKWS
jgi:hypothetical protein